MPCTPAGSLILLQKAMEGGCCFWIETDGDIKISHGFAEQTLRAVEIGAAQKGRCMTRIDGNRCVEIAHRSIIAIDLTIGECAVRIGRHIIRIEFNRG